MGEGGGGQHSDHIKNYLLQKVSFYKRQRETVGKHFEESFRKRLEPLIEWLIEQRKNKKKTPTNGKKTTTVQKYDKFWSVCSFFAGIIDTNPTTRKLSTFFSYLENKSTSGITNLVHDSLRRFRRFRRRNYNPPRHATKYFKNSKPRPSLMNYENYDDYIIDDYDYWN